MKKIILTIITIILIVISIFTIFLVYECIRLYSSYGSYPLIIVEDNVYLTAFNDKVEERSKKIDSIGFNVLYELDTMHENDSNMKYVIKNETFKLFDKIEIWSINK